MDTDDFYSKRRPPPPRQQRQDPNQPRPPRSPYRLSREQGSSNTQQQQQQQQQYNELPASPTSVNSAARMSPYAPPPRGTRTSSATRVGAGTYRGGGGGQREGISTRQNTGRYQLRVDPTSTPSEPGDSPSVISPPESVVSSRSAPVRPPRRKPPSSPGGSDSPQNVPYPEGINDSNQIRTRTSSISSQQQFRYNRSQLPPGNAQYALQESPDEDYEAKRQIREDAMAALEGRTPETTTATSNENFMESLFNEAGFGNGSENGGKKSDDTNGRRDDNNRQGDDTYSERGGKGDDINSERSANAGSLNPTEEVQTLLRRYPILSDHVTRISRNHKKELDGMITQHDSETKKLKRQHGEMIQTVSSKLNKLSLLAKENEKRITETERNKRLKILAMVAEELGMDIGEKEQSTNDNGLVERVLEMVRSVAVAEKLSQKEKKEALEALDEARNGSDGGNGSEATAQALLDSERERKLLEEDLAAAEVNLREAVEAIKVGATRERELREKVKLLEASGSSQGQLNGSSLKSTPETPLDTNIPVLQKQIQDLKTENRNYATTMAGMRDECMKLLTELERKLGSEKKRRIELETELDAERQTKQKESSESEISLSNVAPSAVDPDVTRKQIEDLEEIVKTERKLRSDFEKEMESKERKAEDIELEMDRLKKQNETVKQTVDDLETDIRDLTNERDRMKQTISDLRGEREELEIELQKFRDESSLINNLAASADNAAHVKELEIARTRTEELEEVMKAEQNLRNDLEKELVEKREKAANTEFELDRLRKQRSEVERRVEDLEAVIVDMEEEREQLKHTVSHWHVERQELEAELEAATDKLKEESERVRAHRGERDPKATEKELNLVTRERDGFRDRMFSLETEKLNLEEKIAALERRMKSANGGAVEEGEENTPVARYKNTPPDDTPDAASVSDFKDMIQNLTLELSDTRKQLEDVRENLGGVEKDRESWQTKANLCKDLLERTVREGELAKQRMVELENELEVVSRTAQMNTAEGERGADEEKERVIAEWKKKSDDQERELERSLATLRRVQENHEEEIASQSSEAQAKLEEVQGSLVEAKMEKAVWQDKGEMLKEELERTVRQREEIKLRVEDLERELSEAKMEMRRNMEDGEREADEKKENAINLWKNKAEDIRQELELERERSFQNLQRVQKNNQDEIALQSSDAQAKLDEIRGNLEELEKEKSLWQSKSETLEAELEASAREREQRDQRLEEMENDLKDAIADKKLLQTQLEARESELKKVVQEQEKSRGRMQGLEKELEDVRDNIRSNMEEGEREAGEKESEIALWKKKAEDIQQELDSERDRSLQSLQRLQERYEEEIDGLQQNFEKAKMTVAENSKQLKELVDQKGTIIEREKEIEKQLEVVTKERGDAIKEVQDCKKRAESLERELAEIGSSMDTKVAEHRTKAEKLESRISEVELMLAQERITSASAREALVNHSSELLNLKTSAAEEDRTHRAALSSRDASLKDLASKLSASEATVTELKDDRVKLEGVFKKAAEAREVEFKTRLSESEKSFSSQIAGLNTRLEEGTRLLNSSEGKISGLERQLDILKRELSVVKSRAAEAESQVDATNMEKAVIDGKFRKVERRLAQVEGECDLKIAGYEEKLRLAEEEADRVLAKNMDMMMRLAVYE